MRKDIAIVATIAAIVLPLDYLALNIIELRASNTLLDKLASIQPGMNLNTIAPKLGREMSAFTDVDDILHAGSIQDRSFCEGKKLFIYYAATPPCRAIDVYTDSNNLIVYATWHSL